MEFIVKRKNLKEELALVQPIIERKSTIPVLSNVLIESIGEDKIRIVGTDLDVTLRCEIPAEVKTQGAICVQARKLNEIIRSLDSDDVHFSSDKNDWVNISGANAKFRLVGVSSDTFPTTPTTKAATLKLSGSIINQFIASTSFAITKGQSRFTLSGAKVIADKKSVTMVTTDGHRLAHITAAEGVGGETDAIIPKKALIELVKISVGGEVGFGDDPNHIFFECGNRLLIARKLQGPFPAFEKIIPTDYIRSMSVDCGVFKAAGRRVMLLADPRTLAMRLSLKKGELRLSAKSADDGDGDEIIEADYNGEPVEIGFNAQYLQDFLTVASTQSNTFAEKKNSAQVSMEFKDGNAQTVWKSDQLTGYMCVLMPLRV